MPLLLVVFGGGVFAGLWVRSEVDTSPSLVTLAAAAGAGYVAYKFMRRG